MYNLLKKMIDDYKDQIWISYCVMFAPDEVENTNVNDLKVSEILDMAWNIAVDCEQDKE